MDKKKGSDMLNIKTEELVTTRTVHKVGIWVTLTDLKRIMSALAELEVFDNLSSRLRLELEEIHKSAKFQINEAELDSESEEKARNGEVCETEGCE